MSFNVRSGSGVALVAPAGPCSREAFEAGKAILASRYDLVYDGYQPPASAGDLPYLALEDSDRAHRFNKALQDPAVEAIFCARGGYGCMRILDRLDAACLRRRRLPIVGFSDITALHAWCAREGVPSVHGPVITQLARIPLGQQEALFNLLEGRALPRLEGLERLSGGRAVGSLCGGNLTVLAHLCGTPYAPDLRGRILLLEEVNEPPYRLDRALTQLRLCCGLKEAAGVVMGAYENQGDLSAQRQTARAVLEDRLGDLGVPVVLGAPVGHGLLNMALPLGVAARLDADAGTLEFQR